ncbi:plasmid stability protein [Sphingobium sp. B1D7B]|uniref:FitA-like ribbon-helix-helix domain-containing protein n=1 Tax=Sphingobium sp. B1D7B TaxID=2940578 RepID=UPI0022247D4C|nr:plasmid stabilization protein [Sphingobium sp. B1D7B]MCW2406935.1 plasmid stability protein [Sphingobium sp. B1D7B]
MPALTIRNIPDEIHRGLKILAARHGRSAEAEVRELIAAAVMPPDRMKMGQALWDLGREIGLTEEEFAIMESARDRTPAEPMSFDE